MSKNMLVKTQIKDREALADALLQVCAGRGIKVQTGDNLTTQRYSSIVHGCQFVIAKEELRRTGNVSSFGDIGFRQTADGTYEILLDDFDSRDQALANEVKREYAIAMVTRRAEAQGMRVEFLDDTRQNLRLHPMQTRRPQITQRRY